MLYAGKWKIPMMHKPWIYVYEELIAPNRGSSVTTKTSLSICNLDPKFSWTPVYLLKLFVSCEKSSIEVVFLFCTKNTYMWQMNWDLSCIWGNSKLTITFSRHYWLNCGNYIRKQVLSAAKLSIIGSVTRNIRLRDQALIYCSIRTKVQWRELL